MVFSVALDYTIPKVKSLGKKTIQVAGRLTKPFDDFVQDINARMEGQPNHAGSAK